MKRSLVETILGAVVLLVAGTFLAFGYDKGGMGVGTDGYEVTADFSGIGGLKPGDEVQISGVKVGTVTTVELLPGSYLARVHMNIDSNYKLPADTAAMISSESLLGGLYLSLEPGAQEEMIPGGGRIQYTQAPQNLEQLLGQFIFSMQQDADKTQ
ncbi:MAG TPA: outer membrane lipid asymmetry maintenance protein MlaD [Rhodospirillaceae bacterium]|nr:outer membrane lipid asymmetry maintenance protein MlaD [Rhodospirillaceae bacterium]